MLFQARLHPSRKVSRLKEKEVQALHQAMQEIFTLSISLGGASHEKDLFGNPGNYDATWHKGAYKEKHPCPVYQRPIRAIRTGSTKHYLCKAARG